MSGSDVRAALIEAAEEFERRADSAKARYDELPKKNVLTRTAETARAATFGEAAEHLRNLVAYHPTDEP